VQACGTYGLRREMDLEFWWGNTKKRAFEDIEVNGKKM
jgi:hypothetical protein